METQQHSGLFSPGGCLTASAFRRYLDGSLRPAEKVKVEEHLRHCLICSEALEGYKIHRNSAFMQSDLEAISGRIKKRFSSKREGKRGLPLSILVSLIVFFILLVIIYWIIRYLLLNP